MLTENDFFWKEHMTNNIGTNPLQEYYCIVDVGDYARKYSIVPQYPSEDGVCIDRSLGPEFYIVFESRGHKATDQDKHYPFYSAINFDGYVFENESFVRVFKTLEDAKSRAYIQYEAIFGYVMSHIESDADQATNHHFCVR